MAKTESMSIKEFMSGDWKKPKYELTQLEKDWTVIGKVLAASGGSLILILPKSIMAAPKAVEVAASVGDTFGNVHGAIMNMFDAGVVLVIIFAGASWGLGHRTKAIEILIGVCCGYLLARHAVDIRDFLKAI